MACVFYCCIFFLLSYLIECRSYSLHTAMGRTQHKKAREKAKKKANSLDKRSALARVTASLVSPALGARALYRMAISLTLLRW